MLIKYIFLAFLASGVKCCLDASSNTTLNNSTSGNSTNRTSSSDLNSSSSEINTSTIASINYTSPAVNLTQPNLPVNQTQSKLAISNEVNEKPLICYYGTWAVYRPGDGKFNVENIDPFVCTHIVYAFAGLNYNNEIHPLDSWNDLPDNYGKNAFGRFNALKKKNEKLKTILAIGGWNEGSIKYSSMAKSEQSRKTFVKSVVNMLEKYGFDGLDMDWEYPSNRGGQNADKENFVKLLAELKEAFKPRNYILSAAVSAGFWTIDTAYDIPNVSKHLDFINVMAYDFHGAWEQRTGHNSPLYARPEETGDQLRLNVDYAIKYWIKKGAAKEKIILGIGTYGRTFTLANSQNTSYNAPITGPGAAGPYTREASTLGFNEFCEQQMGSNKWTIVQDEKTMVPYAYRGNQWIGYDDIASVNLKARYANENGLGGAMIWSIETDDFHGKCGHGKFPLLTSIRKGLSNQVVSNPPESSIPFTTSTTTQSPSSSTSRSTAWWSSSTPQSTPWWSSSTSQSTPWWPWSSTSSTQTSHQTSTTVDPFSSTSTSASTPSQTTHNPDAYVCKSEGMFKGSDCATFYQCVYVGEFGKDGSKYRLFVFHCPSGTVFDDKTSLCVWPSAVEGCEHYYDGESTNHI